MKGSVKLPVFIDDARKYVNTTQLRAKYLGASYEAEYCQWQTLHGLGSLMETASLIITPNAYLEGKLIASYPPDPIGDFDVTRATTATRVNSTGLVELVPYNLLQYSNTFGNSYWTKYQSSVTGGQSGYDGSTNAFLLADNGANDVHILQPNFTTSGQHTISIYAKANSLNWVWLRGVQNSANVRAWFNLSTGTIGNVETNGTANIESVGNGWYRCSLTIANHQSGFEFYYGVANANNTTNYVGSGQSIFVQDAQLVEGSTAKDYQKTETRLNIPRLDYSNGTCPSLLVEPQRTNLAIWSSSFANWLPAGGAVAANTSIAPDGTMTADTLNGLRYLQGFGTNVFTFSCYAKANGGSGNFWLRVDVPATNQTTFDLTNGTYSAPSGYTASIEDVGNGWYRCTMTTPSVNVINAVVVSSDYGTNETLIWGAQLEVGSYATSYIPTTSASVTRNADVISKTGISSLIGQTEGTIFGECLVIPQKADSMLCLIRNSSGGLYGDFFYIRASSGVPAVSVRQGDTTYVAIDGTTALSEGYHKFAFAYKQNDFAFYVDGVQIGTDNSGNVPTCNEIYLGNYLDGFDREVSKKSFALWKQRLTNTQLAQLTSI